MRALKFIFVGAFALALLWACDDKDERSEVEAEEPEVEIDLEAVYEAECAESASVSSSDDFFSLVENGAVIVFGSDGGKVTVGVDCGVEWVAENTAGDRFVSAWSDESGELYVTAEPIEAGEIYSGKITLRTARTGIEFATISVYQNEYEVIPDEVDDPCYMKLITFNVRASNADSGEHAWVNRRDACCALLIKENPIIYGVQEAKYEQMTYLNQHTGYSYIGVGRDDGKTVGDTMGVFYKEDEVVLGDWGTFWYSETPDVPSIGFGASYRNTITWAFFTHIYTGKEFFLMNTHMDYLTDTRELQAEMLVDKFYEVNPYGLSTILMGDFNTESTNKTLYCINQIFKSARANAPVTDNHDTYNGWGLESGVIDHFFYTDFIPLEFRTVLDIYFDVEYCSDHWPVEALFAI